MPAKASVKVKITEICNGIKASIGGMWVAKSREMNWASNADLESSPIKIIFYHSNLYKIIVRFKLNTSRLLG